MIEFNATFIVAMLSFVVFILIMNAIFYNPILNIMRKREEYINSNYNGAKAFAEKANEFSADRETKLQETRAKCRHNIKNIVEAAQSQASEKTHEAKEQSKVKIQSKKDVLTNDEQKLKEAVKSTVVKDLASTIASKLLGEDASVSDVNYNIVNKVMD